MNHADCRILLLNPPPLGLLSIGGPLLDAGFPVELLDAEFGPLSPAEIVTQVVKAAPRIVMTGHADSNC